MVGIPRNIYERERTYVIVLIGGDKNKLQKIVLPDYIPNDVESATAYYQHEINKEAFVLACVPYEKYMSEVVRIVDAELFSDDPIEKVTKRPIGTRAVSLEVDMVEVRRLLNEWDEQQEEFEYTTYAAMLRTILQSLKAQEMEVTITKSKLRAILQILKAQGYAISQIQNSPTSAVYSVDKMERDDGFPE